VTDRGAPLFPQAPKRHRIHRGLLTERQEHIFTWMAVIVVLLYATMWIGALLEVRRIRNTPVPVTGGEHTEPAAPPPTPVESITSSFIGPQMPKTSYLTDAMLGFLHPLRGLSGELRFAPALPGSRIVRTAPGAAVAVIDGKPAGDFTAPRQPGIYALSVEIDRARRLVENMSIVTLVPRALKRAGRIGTYQLGTWPFERGGKPRTARYAAPAGFIQVTPENRDFRVSEHFTLGQFLTKDQPNVWPKYVLVDPLLIDKLELTIQELQRQGVRVEHVHVMSGFRTPRYNSGGGNTAGRASLSRHMYGDGADVYVDNNRDGRPDDITGDRRVTTADAEKFGRAAERVESKNRSLVGGIGIYPACCGHGPFTHLDVRGTRARWRGTGSG
jgi:uncharacterized protein YcbK (DUF882 family)